MLSAYNENARAFARFFFHARVMRPVSQCDPSTTILGYKSSIPVFISGAALAKLGHPQGNLFEYKYIKRYNEPADLILFQVKRISLGVQGRHRLFKWFPPMRLYLMMI